MSYIFEPIKTQAQKCVTLDSRHLPTTIIIYRDSIAHNANFPLSLEIKNLIYA